MVTYYYHHYFTIHTSVILLAVGHPQTTPGSWQLSSLHLSNSSPISHSLDSGLSFQGNHKFLCHSSRFVIWVHNDSRMTSGKDLWSSESLVLPCGTVAICLQQAVEKEVGSFPQSL